MDTNKENKQTNSSNKKIKDLLRNTWDLVKYAIIALMIVIPIRIFIAQPFIVSGESMFPTFYNGEYLIIDELSYRFNKPERGDVIIFRYPGDTKRFFIKRIIGLPNEEISINGREVTIINRDNPNGFKLLEPYIKEEFDSTIDYITKEDEYFVMGDNRNKSSDSRIWAKPLTTKLTDKLIIGRAYLRLFPINRMSYLPGYYKEAK